jgi:hypothetical protein
LNGGRLGPVQSHTKGHNTMIGCLPKEVLTTRSGRLPMNNA